MGPTERASGASIALELLPGIHHLSTDITLERFEGIRIYSQSPNSLASIRCTKLASLCFQETNILEIKQLLIDACGGGQNYSGIRVFKVREARINDVAITNSYGSALDVVQSSLILNSIKIIHCGYFDFKHTAIYGGALHSLDSVVVISGNSTFLNNSATFGGAIYSVLGNLTVVENVNFTHNVAAHSGGAIVILEAEHVKIGSNVLFKKNTAVIVGGAVAAHTVPELELSGTFIQNSARFGRAVIVDEATVYAADTVISENHAFVSGGGILSASS